MSTAQYVVSHVIPTALMLLPAPMDSPAARAMLAAIALQESRLRYRRQIGGPARGFWQFERDGGVVEVMEHPSSRLAAARVLLTLGYPPERQAIHVALEHNDVLAACWARLLLWTHPKALPVLGQADEAWQMYLATWRPGKPHPETWGDCFLAGWGIAPVVRV